MDKEQVHKLIELLDSGDAVEIRLARDMIEQVLPTLPGFCVEMMTGAKDWLVTTLFKADTGLWCIEQNHLWLNIPDRLENKPLLYIEEKKYVNGFDKCKVYPSEEPDILKVRAVWFPHNDRLT
jgi:hypothetical protein